MVLVSLIYASLFLNQVDYLVKAIVGIALDGKKSLTLHQEYFWWAKHPTLLHKFAPSCHSLHPKCVFFLSLEPCFVFMSFITI